MRVNLLDVNRVLFLLFLHLLFIVLLDCRDVDTALILVVVHLPALFIIVVTLIADLSQPVALRVILVVLVEDDCHARSIVQALLGANRVVLLLIFNIRTEVRDLLREAEQLGKKLVRDGAQDLFNVFFTLRIKDAVCLDGGQDLVRGTPKHVGGLVTQWNLESIQQLLVHALRLLCPRPVDLHFCDVCAQNRLALIDVHLSLLLDHAFSALPLFLILALLFLLDQLL
mmetsp:Transcript_58332/g.131382  ORF Transcript_58332/g.131382 Transcript_58332/m.131382 type:complete len:227 (+) Transcript_58332:1616-2296(+)